MEEQLYGLKSKMLCPKLYIIFLWKKIYAEIEGRSHAVRVWTKDHYAFYSISTNGLSYWPKTSRYLQWISKFICKYGHEEEIMNFVRMCAWMSPLEEPIGRSQYYDQDFGLGSWVLSFEIENVRRTGQIGKWTANFDIYGV